jgi:lysophospholipid acyltransferase (LPLAT)-like uncharacterized protein
VTTRSLTLDQRAKAALVAAVGSPLIAALGRTLRWQVEGYEHYDAIRRQGRQPIFAFWHGRILPATWFWRDRDIVVMTSENFDGEWIARIIRRFGYGVARGSTSKGGARALARLRREMHAGKSAAFTLDGPRGPACTAQPGAVWLSGLTGNPILPFHIEAARYWVANSWDCTQIPKPFSRVAVAIGEPVQVEMGSTEIEREVARVALQETLARLSVRTEEMLRGHHYDS